MPKVRKLTPGASPAHHFGAEVRRARKEADMTLADLAAMVPCDASTVSRIESGFIAPDLHFAGVCDAAFPFCRGWFTRFISDSAEWADNAELAPAFRDFAEDEREATVLLVCGTTALPGLLQVESYARAVLSRHPGVTEELVTSRLAARMARQAVLDTVTMYALIDEPLLSREIGGSEVMAEALRHLAESARRPNINIQVIPAGDYHVGLQGAFDLAEINGSVASVFIDDITDGRTTTDATTVADVTARYRHLQSLSLPIALSLEILDKAAGRYGNGLA